jgi:hypothetical protein
VVVGVLIQPLDTLRACHDASISMRISMWIFVTITPTDGDLKFCNYLQILIFLVSTFP